MDSIAKSAVVAPETISGAKTIVLTHDKQNSVRVVCEVCGYANPEHTAICKMCSNYLEESK